MEYPLGHMTALINRDVFAALGMLFTAVLLTASGLAVVNAGLLIRGQRASSSLLLRALRAGSFFIVPVPFFASLVLGLFVWFYAALLLPSATSALIHQFMWLLAMQGFVLIVQAAAAYAYHTGWRVLTMRDHARWALIFAASSWFGVLTISEIASFILTPDAWLESFRAVDAYINPSFFPLLIVLTAWGVVLGSVAFTFIVQCLAGLTAGEKKLVLAKAARWLWTLAGALPVVILLLMVLEDAPLARAAERFAAGGMGTAVAILFIVLGKRESGNRIGATGAATAFALLVASTMAFHSGYVRLKDPYAIRNYIYTNDIALDAAPRMRREGILTYAHTIVPAGIDLSRVAARRRGEWVFRALRYGDYLGATGGRLRSELRGMAFDEARIIIEHLPVVDSAIPPFIGTPRELDDLTVFLTSPFHDRDGV